MSVANFTSKRRRLADATNEPTSVRPLSETAITWRIATVARELGINRRTLERERAAGRFPAPDLVIGKMPLWRPETIRSWAESGGSV